MIIQFESSLQKYFYHLQNFSENTFTSAIKSLKRASILLFSMMLKMYKNVVNIILDLFGPSVNIEVAKTKTIGVACKISLIFSVLSKYPMRSVQWVNYFQLKWGRSQQEMLFKNDFLNMRSNSLENTREWRSLKIDCLQVFLLLITTVQDTNKADQIFSWKHFFVKRIFFQIVITFSDITKGLQLY